MAAKSADLYARIEPDVKEQAGSILSALGIPASNAINKKILTNHQMQKALWHINVVRWRNGR